MDDLLELIFLIEKKGPGVFIGNDDIEYLARFLSGYCFAKEEALNPSKQFDNWIRYGDWLWKDFSDFLAEKYQDRRSFNWPKLIAHNESDGNSTDAFFRLLHEYLETGKS